MGEPRDWEAGGYSVSGQGPAQAHAGSWGSGEQAATLREGAVHRPGGRHLGLPVVLFCAMLQGSQPHMSP